MKVRLKFFPGPLWCCFFHVGAFPHLYVVDVLWWRIYLFR